MSDSKRSRTSTIGLIVSFIGMAGLVLSIVSLLPLNLYNIYTTITTICKLLVFEQKKTDKHWEELSTEAIMYLVFLCGSCCSSMFEIGATVLACFRSADLENSESATQQLSMKQYQSSHTLESSTHRPISRYDQRTSWFIRIIGFTILLQIVFSLLGTHILLKLKRDILVIPKEVQDNAYISCAILWINYVSLLVFCFVLLFASFCILIGAHRHTSLITSGNDSDESRPLIIA
ncbi:hypothetical protein EDC96DRAFT_528093 [Choanephora cucurbitarum]|nr:hypothetical protein EDC96DRAFT_528093 [Choanephora cucurbitarum]